MPFLNPTVQPRGTMGVAFLAPPVQSDMSACDPTAGIDYQLAEHVIAIPRVGNRTCVICDCDYLVGGRGRKGKRKRSESDTNWESLKWVAGIRVSRFSE